ncbi:PASTA domain-containing protein [Paenibacillus sp. GP183]|jgi:eukaryotic-like serine/threonine-protein kinase|uniref:PASTA domain-containing protein n=1 Tax=Paenibacillus sp. GP183 TaxID=1882751 RepID=UPI000895226A|nr:PASTA domain-containing protein [Paenibacillus sp. GP183]SEB40041.1 PASTA domain-containing protein [Paenibacillus sp. GP183]
MTESIETRYVPSTLIRSFSNGALQKGEDIYLNRKVLLYTIKGQTTKSVEEYVSKLSKIAAFKHEGFHYILDTAFGEHSVLIVQESKPGRLLLEEIQQKHWTFSEAVSLVATLGISMLDAMERQITGFSTGIENVWVAADGRLSILNYWDEGEPQKQGAVGLCGLLLQMLSRAAVRFGPYEALHTHLENIQIASSKEQKDALVKLFKRVSLGQASLSALVFGLQSLPAAYESEEAQIPFDIQKEPVPARFYKFVGAGVFTIVFLGLMIWFLSSSSFLNRNETLTTKDIVKPTVNTTNTPVPQNQPIAKDIPSNPPQNELTTPTLVGLTQAEAEKQALSSGLHYKYFIEPNGQAQGAVFKQDPQPGSNISKGDNVTFWIGK